LSDPDRRIIDCHPALSVAMLQRVPTMEPLLRLAAFQHHERETGVGYPAQTRGERICDFAKVLAVCDVFAAATGPRAYHPGKLPYVVMEEIIRSAAAGIFDKSATRALVRAAGLFPVGSCVLLSTNQFAQVLAANPDRLDRPLVRIFNDDGQPGGDVIDLAAVEPQKLSVTRPSPPPRIAFPAA
jgi:HD-GYP domain-containing protein (c-di-GMP phosphodiesterase class II)